MGVDELTLLDEIPGEVSIHGWLNVLITCWPRLSRPSGVRLLAEVRSRYLVHHPEGASLIHISADPSVPDAETSAEWVEMMKRYSERVRCIAVLVPAHGFQASRVRSWVTEKRMIEAPGEFKMRFHSTVDELMAWLPEEHEARTGVHLPRGRTFHHLRRLVDATVAPSDARPASG